MHWERRVGDSIQWISILNDKKVRGLDARRKWAIFCGSSNRCIITDSGTRISLRRIILGHLFTLNLLGMM